MPPPQVHGIARRIHGWSWQSFPILMGTSAVYMTLSALKHHPAFVSSIETVFFFLSITLFFANIVMLLLQAICAFSLPAIFPRHAWSRLQDPIQGTFVVSFATIVVGTMDYDLNYGHISSNLVFALFCIYLVIAIATCFPMIKITFSQPHDLPHFAPSYAFPVFPLMLTGLVSANTLKVIDASDPRALGILLVGYVVHGLGLFLAFFFLVIYIIRLMMNGFMDGRQSNVAFVACSPPGFSALTLISLGDHARTILGARGYINEATGDIWYSASVMASLLLYGLALFFFIFGVIPYRFSLRRHLDGILDCWALTFPNVGWINATRSLGDIFQIQGFFTFHLVMTVFMCITWLFLFTLTVIAFCKGRIFKSGKEDFMRDIQAQEEVAEERPAPVVPSSAHHLEGCSRALITV
ncbi:voltage-dependent anion channel [Desarmillaria tabescens]|uniref:Voltage-dependent anion channel n=1 Tax=Armillaria tabescens TaxID=1929756 RepID=A0AA39K3M0_ARMTA|nr:voltage-dependent anion channel [Desarmillaria tabescens]KAK0452756.1 voltage-dependent anion channel [Desarmillaria tabescens]